MCRHIVESMGGKPPLTKVEEEWLDVLVRVFDSDEFNPLPATGGERPKPTKRMTKIWPSGGGRKRVTEDRERSMGSEIIPAQL